MLYLNDVVAKITNYDAYGLFRASHSHTSLQYSHIVRLMKRHRYTFFCIAMP